MSFNSFGNFLAVVFSSISMVSFSCSSPPGIPVTFMWYIEWVPYLLDALFSSHSFFFLCFRWYIFYWYVFELAKHVFFVSVQFSRSVMSDSLWSHEPHHTRPPCPSPTPWVYPNSCPLSRGCHPTISYSAIKPVSLVFDFRYCIF